MSIVLKKICQLWSAPVFVPSVKLEPAHIFFLLSKSKRFKAQRVMDLQPGDEAGIKSATFTVKGQYALLNEETII